MRNRRLFVELPLNVGSQIELPQDAASHISKVLKIRTGEEVILFNGIGGEYPARVELCSKKSVVVSILDFVSISRESPLNITLAQCLIRSDAMDLVVQKACELGVKHIVPLQSKRSVVRLNSDKLHIKQAHWQKVAIAACEQCGRNEIPTIDMPQIFSKWIQQSEYDSMQCYIGLPDSKTVDLPELERKQNHNCLILIGAEGGFDPMEIGSAQDKGFASLNLGARILRAETAALSAITKLQIRYGDM